MAGKLSDDEIGLRLMAAWEALHLIEAQTEVGETTLEAAKKALILLYAGLKRASDRGGDDNPVIMPRGPLAPAEIG